MISNQMFDQKAEALGDMTLGGEYHRSAGNTLSFVIIQGLYVA